ERQQGPVLRRIDARLWIDRELDLRALQRLDVVPVERALAALAPVLGRSRPLQHDPAAMARAALRLQEREVRCVEVAVDEVLVAERGAEPVAVAVEEAAVAVARRQPGPDLLGQV